MIDIDDLNEPVIFITLMFALPYSMLNPTTSMVITTLKYASSSSFESYSGKSILLKHV